MPDNEANVPGSRVIIDLTQVDQLPNETIVQDNLDFERGIEDELRLEEERQRYIEEQLNIEEVHQQQMECLHQQEIQMQADRRLLQENEERERLEAESRVRIHNIANEMREASPTGFLPPISQVECVTKERYTVFEAITRGGDNQTPCQRCSRNDPDDCFWLTKTVFMNL